MYFPGFGLTTTFLNLEKCIDEHRNSSSNEESSAFSTLLETSEDEALKTMIGFLEELHEKEGLTMIYMNKSKLCFPSSGLVRGYHRPSLSSTYEDTARATVSLCAQNATIRFSQITVPKHNFYKTEHIRNDIITLAAHTGSDKSEHIKQSFGEV